MATSNSSLRTPPKARLANLTTIAERITTSTPPPIPRRSSRRKSQLGSPAASHRPWTAETADTAPPAYDWVPEPDIGEEDGRTPIEGEKLAQLRKDEGWRKPRMRGGWGRLWIIVGVAAVVLLALAVGLSVGLSKKKRSSSNSGGSSSGDSSTPQKFPLGEYSFVTALMMEQAYCTSNPATWSCYPYTTFDPTSGGGDTSSQAYFNWEISNTEDNYATADSTPSTPSSGVPANLTITSQSNPFGITFGPKPLTYFASDSNSTSPRYTFSFTQTKKVIPNPSVASDGSPSECYFNQTIFTGTIYLSAGRNYPSGDDASSSSIGGFPQWPHAVEIMQIASGGDNVPNCYETVNGDAGSSIDGDAGIVPQAGSFDCVCDYRNYY